MIESYHAFGSDFDEGTIRQMQDVIRLPITAAASLMPDAHQGYGLPIGGVLATRNAVIPYAVGVDIACRVKLTVFDKLFTDVKIDKLIYALKKYTRFGVGACYHKRQHHPVMDKDWSFSSVLQNNKDLAWSQLGTSGSGNHFVEFGYNQTGHLSLLSHSGSRKTGYETASYYSAIARRKRPEFGHLAWLDIDSCEGQEYWKAMLLMGEYSSANHAMIHDSVISHLGYDVLQQIENHHNFAWLEHHNNEKLVVHRKGATPAGNGVLGIICGTMVDKSYIVAGKGNPDSLASASHGAGRCMSRTQAKKKFSDHLLLRAANEREVHVISAGIDEHPLAYKDIDLVMNAQADLIQVVDFFQPSVVMMSPSHERAED